MVAQDLIPLGIAILVITLIFGISRIIFVKQIAIKPTANYYKQLFNALLFSIALIVVVSAAPIQTELKGQILGLIGIVLSGAIALSSTTVLGNTLA